MRIVHFLFACLFGLFAYFQFNDPDSLVWTAFYGMITLVALIAALFRPLKGLIWVCVGAGLILGLQSYQGVIDYATNQDGVGLAQGMSNDKPYIEQTREFGGLVIVAVWAILGLLTTKSCCIDHCDASKDS